MAVQAKGIAKGGSGVPVTPFCQPILSKQHTTRFGGRHGNLVSTLTLSLAAPLQASCGWLLIKENCFIFHVLLY